MGEESQPQASGRTLRVRQAARLPEIERARAVGALRRRAREAPQTWERTRDMALPKGSRAVLLVDDEEMVRELVRECLEGAGYGVVAASSGDEALRLCAEGPRHFALVITDRVMPDMRGEELVARLRQSQPDLRAICMSGYANNNPTEDAGEARPTTLLEKPFAPADLMRAVREALRDPPGDLPEGARRRAGRRRSRR